MYLYLPVGQNKENFSLSEEPKKGGKMKLLLKLYETLGHDEVLSFKNGDLLQKSCFEVNYWTSIFHGSLRQQIVTAPEFTSTQHMRKVL